MGAEKEGRLIILIGRPFFWVGVPESNPVDNQSDSARTNVLAQPSYATGYKPKEEIDMVIVILILIFCGAMALLCRMICGFAKLLSNSKKKMR